MVRTITNPEQQAWALRDVVTAIAKTDPDQTQVSDRVVCSLRNPTVRPVVSPPYKRSRRLLALAWYVISWEIPVSALPVVDPTALRALLIES
ncbi:hypothetical protein [Nocardia noduli]|uniref:hypothetical protein n=1 Tax=Nocardia noduli TaxID=2815722 RepID=UPI001C22A62A|nr:hypothetical protein [Nocardia noduli]